MGPLLAYQWRRHRVVALVVPLGLFVFQWLITKLAPAPDQVATLGAMLQMFPKGLINAMGLDDAMSVTTQGVIGFGYVHPFTLLLFGLWTVRVSAGGLAGEIGAGTLDLVAARPVPRWQIVLSVTTALAAGLIVCAAACWAGTAAGLGTRDLGGLRAAQFAPLAMGVALLFAGFAGFGLAVSAAQRTAGDAIGIVSAVMAVSFAVEYIARAWEPMRWMRPFTPFRYFEPEPVFLHGIGSQSLAVLGGLAVGGLVVAMVIFQRRDL